MSSKKIGSLSAVSLCLFLAQAGQGAAETPAWNLLSPNGLSVHLFRGGHSTVYDPTANELIVFGGAAPTEIALNDTWILTHANGLGGTGTWTRLIPNGAAGSPPARWGHSAVYDEAHNRMIVFGGCPTGGSCANPNTPTLPLNDVWVLSNANGVGGNPSWTQLFTTGAPAGRSGHAAIYDPGSNSMVVFGGSGDGGCVAASLEVWVLSNANGLNGTPKWTQLFGGTSTTMGIFLSAASYDPANNIMTVFGGLNTSCVPTNAVWTFSHANGTGGTPAWINVVLEGASGSPRRRYGVSAVYDQSSNRMTIFGGSNSVGRSYNDTWVLADANGIGGAPTWTQLHPVTPLGTGGPRGREAVTFAAWPPGSGVSGLFDPVNDRMIIFGGYLPFPVEGPLWSTWVLTDANGL